MTSPLTQTGGGMKIGYGYWDSWHATAPFVRIDVDDVKIELTASVFFVSRRYTFPFTHVHRITMQRGWFSRALSIEHRVADYPPRVLLWSPDLAALVITLNERGLNVEGL